MIVVKLLLWAVIFWIGANFVKTKRLNQALQEAALHKGDTFRDHAANHSHNLFWVQAGKIVAMVAILFLTIWLPN